MKHVFSETPTAPVSTFIQKAGVRCGHFLHTFIPQHIDRRNLCGDASMRRCSHRLSHQPYTRRHHRRTNMLWIFFSYDRNHGSSFEENRASQCSTEMVFKTPLNTTASIRCTWPRWSKRYHHYRVCRYGGLV